MDGAREAGVRPRSGLSGWGEPPPVALHPARGAGRLGPGRAHSRVPVRGPGVPQHRLQPERRKRWDIGQGSVFGGSCTTCPTTLGDPHCPWAKELAGFGTLLPWNRESMRTPPSTAMSCCISSLGQLLARSAELSPSTVGIVLERGSGVRGSVGACRGSIPQAPSQTLQ
mmetsp:Transcript_92894/g.160963  ORF Transcript_92894/g.160963 Transcript_92894/m.160963 type:complete len:169 (-) Transcript_92894:33-539(-)